MKIILALALAASLSACVTPDPKSPVAGGKVNEPGRAPNQN